MRYENESDLAMAVDIILAAKSEENTDLVQADCIYDLLKVARQIAEAHGRTHFALLRMPSVTKQFSASDVVLSNWPNLAIAALVSQCPTTFLRIIQQALAPFAVTLSGDVCDGLACEDGMACNGLVVPMADHDGRRFAMIFTSTRGHKAAEDFSLVTAALGFFERYAFVTDDDGAQERSLSAREVECLAWISEGKTSLDVSSILGISPHTVNHYLNNAQEKLGANNRTQAVAIALRTRLIE